MSGLRVQKYDNLSVSTNIVASALFPFCFHFAFILFCALRMRGLSEWRVMVVL